MSSKRRRRAKARRALTRRIVEYYRSYSISGDSKIAAYLDKIFRIGRGHEFYGNLNSDVAHAVNKELGRR